MKRLMFAGLLALGLASVPQAARADCAFEYSCSRHFSYVHTAKQRCLTYSSHSNPLPCAPACGPVCGPAMWNGLAAYGYAGYGYPDYGYAAAAPVAATPAATTPAPSTTTPYRGPQPSPAAPAAGNGVQQAGYFYYAPTTANAGYGYGAGYSYYGNSYQAPSYWFGN